MPSTSTATKRKIRLPSRRPRTKSFAPPAPEPPEIAGFQVTKPKGTAGTRVRLTVLIAAAAVVAFLGVRAIVVSLLPTGNASTSATTEVAMSPDAARSAAATFAADYLAHDPATTAPKDNPLAHDLAPGADPSRMAWAGTGFLGTDLAIPGQVTTVDAAHAVVAVQARVILAMPAGDIDRATAPPVASTTAAPAPSGRFAAGSRLPAGFKVTSTQWLALQVPVISTGGSVLVDVSGPVFSPDPVVLAAPLQADSKATDATTAWVKTMFASYAAGSTAAAYLTAPGTNLTGLSGAVEVTDVTTWSLSEPDPDGLRHGSARVGWTFAPGADLTTSQTYSITVQTADNRYYVAAVGPSITASN